MTSSFKWRLVRGGLGLAAALGLSSCGDDAGSSAGAPEEVCDLAPLKVGAKKTGEKGLGLELLEFEPDPPARFDNRWVVELKGKEDPVSDGTIKVTPFMPLHQHGASEPVVVTEVDTGHFELQPINLWMPGLWEVRFGISAGGVNDNVVFEVCIDD